MTATAAVRWLIAGLLLVPLVVPAPRAAAQEMAAEVRTWDGRVLQLSQVSVEVFYTIMPKAKEGESAMGGGAAGSPPPTSDPGGPRLFGSVQSLSQFFGKQPDPLQAHRRVDRITLQMGAAEVQVPLANIDTLQFTRTLVLESQLPPHVVASHFRHAATARLKDGSTVQADNVALGTTVLRGMSPLGRVEIPWNSIESIRFRP